MLVATRVDHVLGFAWDSAGQCPGEDPQGMTALQDSFWKRRNHVCFILIDNQMCDHIPPQEAQGMGGRERGALKARKVIAWSDSFFILCLCLISLLSVIVSDSEPWRL